ncbi:hypothetical protein HPP92_013977 [Vanilla planifolia]|uniref:Uncharacterized protein n=1 Tax=Vanilla planifolia TaxID=51239 RepID=A0A835QJ62_VANPL|nr:hypothetical protein HPP92_013977 [Vanilla planifolia]
MAIEGRILGIVDLFIIDENMVIFNGSVFMERHCRQLMRGKGAWFHHQRVASWGDGLYLLEIQEFFDLVVLGALWTTN